MLFYIRVLTFALAAVVISAPTLASGLGRVCPTYHDSWEETEKRLKEDADVKREFGVTPAERPGLESYISVKENNALVVEKGTLADDHTYLLHRINMLSEEPPSTFFASIVFYRYGSPQRAASVSGNEGKYDLAIDMAFADDVVVADLILLHEFGHAILGTSSAGPKIRPPSEHSKQSKAPEFPGSYFTEFWSECDGPIQKKSMRSYATPLATKNVWEDLAETWVSFVICSPPDDDDVSVFAKKRRHMWGSGDLRARRTHIHATFGKESIDSLRRKFPMYCASRTAIE
ncbi:MAG: hypothetical protein WA021_05655 [Minisyncoccia bacterium]